MWRQERASQKQGLKDRQQKWTANIPDVLIAEKRTSSAAAGAGKSAALQVNRILLVLIAAIRETSSMTAGILSLFQEEVIDG